MDEKYNTIVYGSAATAAGIGVPGVFVPDIGPLATLWAAMLAMIAAESGHDMDKNFALKVATGVATGAGAMVTGIKTFTWCLKWLPGVGTGTAIVINSSLNYTFTYRLGKAFAELVDCPDFTLYDAGTLTLALVGIVKE